MFDLENTRYLRDLRDEMDKTFNLSEIKMLCFDLPKVDYEHLAGENENKLIKIQSLINYLGRRGRLHELRQLLIEKRPETKWPEIPPDSEKIKNDIEILDPVPPPQDSALVAGLITTIAIVCCGYLWGYGNRSIGFLYFICVIVFLFAAIYGFILAKQLKSKRAQRLSIALGLLSAFPYIYVILMVLASLIGIRLFGQEAVNEFFTKFWGQ